MMIINCKEKAQQIKDEAKAKAKGLSLAVIQVGNDYASDVYVRNKKRACEECGIEFVHFQFDEDVTFKTLKAEISSICASWRNGEPAYTGVMIQLPLPSHLKPFERDLLNIIPYYQDVDGLSTDSIGRLQTGEECLVPCTAAGVMHLLPEDMTGMNVQVINRSHLIGLPLVQLLQRRDATVTLMHSKSDIETNKIGHLQNVVVTATGRPKFINNINLNKSSKFDSDLMIIDCGISHDENGKLCGDVDYKNMNGAFSVTPTPGGTGVLTVACLIENIVNAKNLWKKRVEEFEW